jgi:sugar (pentulose or hexulose) kinase
LKIHPDFDTAVKAMTRVSQVFNPNPHNHGIYDGLYNRVYKRLYSRLRPLYEEIREITGYPGKVGK